jgi:hypothetical protein
MAGGLTVIWRQTVHAVGIGQDFEINGVMHIMTDSGLKPK